MVGDPDDEDFSCQKKVGPKVVSEKCGRLQRSSHAIPIKPPEYLLREIYSVMLEAAPRFGAVIRACINPQAL